MMWGLCRCKVRAQTGDERSNGRLKLKFDTDRFDRRKSLFSPQCHTFSGEASNPTIWFELAGRCPTFGAWWSTFFTGGLTFYFSPFFILSPELRGLRNLSLLPLLLFLDYQKLSFTNSLLHQCGCKSVLLEFVGKETTDSCSGYLW